MSATCAAAPPQESFPVVEAYAVAAGRRALSAFLRFRYVVSIVLKSFPAGIVGRKIYQQLQSIVDQIWVRRLTPRCDSEFGCQDDPRRRFSEAFVFLEEYVRGSREVTDIKVPLPRTLFRRVRVIKPFSQTHKVLTYSVKDDSEIGLRARSNFILQIERRMLS